MRESKRASSFSSVPSATGKASSTSSVVEPALLSITVVQIRAGVGDPCVETCFNGTSVRSCTNAVSGADDGNPERGQCHLNDGLMCQSSTLTCVPTLERGAACEWSEDCGAYATCDGICMDGRVEGEPCSAFSECQEGLDCSVDSDTCEPGDRLRLEATCSIFSE